MTSSTASSARQVEIQKTHDLYAGCTACSLHKNRLRSLHGTGNINAKIVFILDRFFPTEVGTQEFFTGQNSEFVIRALLAGTGKKVEDFWYTPSVACPTVSKQASTRLESLPVPKRAEVVACSSRIYKEIYTVDPQLVVCMGTEAIRVMFPTETPQLHYYHGEIQCATLPGRVAPYEMPVLLLHSTHSLYTQQSVKNSDIWEKTWKYLSTAIDIVDFLTKG